MGRCEDEGVTADLYPHRRIKITELVKPGPAKPPQVRPQSVEPPTPPSSPSPDRQVVEKSGTFARLSNLFLSHSFLPYRKGSTGSTNSFLAQIRYLIVNVDSLSRILSLYFTAKTTNTSALSCPKS